MTILVQYSFVKVDLDVLNEGILQKLHYESAQNLSFMHFRSAIVLSLLINNGIYDLYTLGTLILLSVDNFSLFQLFNILGKSS